MHVVTSWTLRLRNSQELELPGIKGQLFTKHFIVELAFKAVSKFNTVSSFLK